MYVSPSRLEECDTVRIIRGTSKERGASAIINGSSNYSEATSALTAFIIHKAGLQLKLAKALNWLISNEYHQPNALV